MRALPFALLLGAAVLACGAASAKPAASTFDKDVRLQQPLTIHVTGVALSTLLPQVGRELGVTLRPETQDVGDIRVSVFLGNVTGQRVLSSLAEMLNLTQGKGFSWQTSSSEPHLVYTLTQDLRSRSLAVTRDREHQRRIDQAFLDQLAAIRNARQVAVPEKGKPLAGFKADGTDLLVSLPDAQLRQLLQDGVLTLRPGEGTPRQQQALQRLGSQVMEEVMPLLSRPGFADDPLYQDLQPGQATAVLELSRSATGVSVRARVSLGPDKGGIDDTIFPTNSGDDAPMAAQAASPARKLANTLTRELGGDPEITLHPRSDTMADVLADLARRSRLQIVSDCYTQLWEPVAHLPASHVSDILARIDGLYGIEVQPSDGVLLIRSKIAHTRQQLEVPNRVTNSWTQRVHSAGFIDLDTLAEMSQLSDDQLSNLEACPALQESAPHANLIARGTRQYAELYRLLAPAQRAQVANGGFTCRIRELTPEQQGRVVRWLRRRSPDIPEAQYGEIELAMALSPERKWEVSWRAGSRAKKSTWWLDVGFDPIFGKAQELPQSAREPLAGRAAPTIQVTALDGTAKEIVPEGGGPLLLTFWQLWPVPYVSKIPLSPEGNLLPSSFPQPGTLRIVVIFPFDSLSELRDWQKGSRYVGPVYLDPGGSAYHRYASGDLPAAFLISAGGKVQLARSRFDQVTAADWLTLTARTPG